MCFFCADNRVAEDGDMFCEELRRRGQAEEHAGCRVHGRGNPPAGCPAHQRGRVRQEGDESQLLRGQHLHKDQDHTDHFQTAF